MQVQFKNVTPITTNYSQGQNKSATTIYITAKKLPKLPKLSKEKLLGKTQEKLVDAMDNYENAQSGTKAKEEAEELRNSWINRVLDFFI